MFEFNVTMGVNIKIKITFLHSPNLKVNTQHIALHRFDSIAMLSGKPVAKTWTTLASTANAGSTTIVLQDTVSWKAGDQLIIATTSHRHSQRENEFRTIQSVAPDQKTVTLTQALTYEHLGVSETFDGTQVEFRAEVGMVTRNIKIQGASDSQWVEKIEACPDGFDTGKEMLRHGDCEFFHTRGTLRNMIVTSSI